MKANIQYLVICFLILIACSQEKDHNERIQKTVSEYFKIYQKHEDFASFMSYYDESIILEDIIVGDEIIGKEALSSFFNWNNPSLKRLSKDALVVKSQMIVGNQVITSGYFTEFEWKNTKFGTMDFITIHVFNEDLKIVKQVDWINYPANLLNPDSSTQNKKPDKIEGTWKLLEFADRDTISKQWAYPFGEKAQGYFTYTHDKTVTVNIFNQNPLRTSKDSINTGSYTFSDILFNSASYFGNYSLDHEKGTVIHHVKGGTIPWYINTDQSRPFKLQNDTLFIGDMINWKRVLVKID